jgi:hypothetical protein
MNVHISKSDIRMYTPIEYKYKAALVPFGYYEWNVMHFELKNTPSEFQNIMKIISLHILLIFQLYT